jgi:hypothetical protein
MGFTSESACGLTARGGAEHAVPGFLEHGGNAVERSALAGTRDPGTTEGEQRKYLAEDCF